MASLKHSSLPQNCDWRGLKKLKKLWFRNWKYASAKHGKKPGVFNIVWCWKLGCSSCIIYTFTTMMLGLSVIRLRPFKIWILPFYKKIQNLYRLGQIFADIIVVVWAANVYRANSFSIVKTTNELDYVTSSSWFEPPKSVNIRHLLHGSWKNSWRGCHCLEHRHGRILNNLSICLFHLTIHPIQIRRCCCSSVVHLILVLL